MDSVFGWLILVLVGVVGGKVGWRFWQDKRMLKEVLQQEQDRKNAEAANVTTAMERLEELRKAQKAERLKASGDVRDLFEKKK